MLRHVSILLFRVKKSKHSHLQTKQRSHWLHRRRPHGSLVPRHRTTPAFGALRGERNARSEAPQGLLGKGYVNKL